MERSFVIQRLKWNLLAIILTVLFSEVKSNLQTSLACSPRHSSADCKWFNTTISCLDTERILIRDAVFGFRYKELASCDYTSNRCMASDECCSPKDGDETSEYSQQEKYKLYKECSWKQKCTTRAPTGYRSKMQSLYSIVKYECVKEKQIIHFCQESTVTGKSVNIIFDGNRKSALDTPTECTCVLVPRSGKVQYTVNAPDIRLITRGGNCDSEATLSGVGDVNISCSAMWENWTSTRVMLGERQFRLGSKARPEFIWIRVEVYDSTSSPTVQIDPDQVTVKCYKPVQQTISTTQVSSTATDSTTGEASGVASSSSDFPVLAVVIPVILIVAGLAVLLIFLIHVKYRARKGNTMTNKEKGDIINDNLEPAQKTKYETLFSPEVAERTPDNYIVLEPENVYSSIRSDDIYPIDTVSGLVKANGHYTSLTPDNNADIGYTNLALDTTDNATDRIEEDMNSVINDLEQIAIEEGEENHDFLVLDPQSLYQDSDTAGLSDSENRHKSSNDNYEKSMRELSD